MALLKQRFNGPLKFDSGLERAGWAWKGVSADGVKSVELEGSGGVTGVKSIEVAVHV